jgi:hypothetical protein
VTLTFLKSTDTLPCIMSLDLDLSEVPLDEEWPRLSCALPPGGGMISTSGSKPCGVVPWLRHLLQSLGYGGIHQASVLLIIFSLSFVFAK